MRCLQRGFLEQIDGKVLDLFTYTCTHFTTIGEHLYKLCTASCIFADPNHKGITIFHANYMSSDAKPADALVVYRYIWYVVYLEGISTTYTFLVRLLAASCFNSLRPSDAIRRQRSGSTLAQVMSCCLTAPSHYLNKCWLSSLRSREVHLRAISLEISQPSVTKINLKIIFLRFYRNLPGANELTTMSVHYLYMQLYVSCSSM